MIALLTTGPSQDGIMGSSRCLVRVLNYQYILNLLIPLGLQGVFMTFFSILIASYGAVLLEEDGTESV